MDYDLGNLKPSEFFLFHLATFICIHFVLFSEWVFNTQIVLLFKLHKLEYINTIIDISVNFLKLWFG